ncbi:MAG TPA: TlpA disulfide reductase family protein [Gemmataceae bacterium]|nr:TlpA disulfide reductase family protein [Gemmataceae bacterium]
MYPHERSLVKRLQDKPFALLGINSDPQKDKLKEAMEKEQITWRSWWDKTTSGPIATEWNVHAWPTIYVLDQKGVIRAKNVRGEVMDKLVDDLLKEMKESKTP